MKQANAISSVLTWSNSIYNILLDKDGKFLYANSIYRKIFGLDINGEDTLSFIKSLDPEDVRPFHLTIQECIRDSSTVNIDLKNYRSDNSFFWTRWEFSPYRGAGDADTSIQGVGYDITERIRAEEEKIVAQKNLKIILDNSEEAFLVLDRDFRVISYNKMADFYIRSFSGINLKRGVPFLMYSHPDTADRYEKLFHNALHGRMEEIIIDYTTTSGEKEYIFVGIRPLYNEENFIYGLIITSRNITAKRKAEEKLIENERYFRALIENSSDALVIIDRDRNINTMSPSAVRILGYSKEELDSIDHSSIIHPDDWNLLIDTLEQIYKSPDMIRTIEYRILTKLQGYRWVSATYHNLFHEPSIQGIVINFNDISSRKLAEQALHLSESKYRFLFHNNPQPMWIYDLDTLHFLEVNDSAIEHYGYTMEEFFSMSIRDIRPVEDLDAMKQQVEKAKSSSGIINNERIWRHITKNGNIIYVELKSHTLTFNGRAASLVSVNDITKLIEAEQALIKSNERFEMAGQATSDAIWDADLVTSRLHWGQGFAKLFGYQVNPEFESMNTWTDYIHPEDRQRVVDSLNLVLEHPRETFWKEQYRFIRADRSVAYVIDRGILVRNEYGKAVRMIGAMQDITEQKESEKRLDRERNLLRTLIDHIPDLIFVKDMHSRHIINNKATVERIGAKDEKSTLGKTILEYYGSSAIPYLEYDKQVLTTGQPLEIKDDMFETRSGDVQWLNTTLIPLKHQEQVIGLVGISRDITERILIEESLKNSNERFTIVSKATNDAIWDWDLKSGMISWNEALRTVFGYGETEVDSEWLLEKIHPEDREAYRLAITYHIKNRIEHWQSEFRLLAKDGTYRNILDRGYILFDQENQPYRMIGSLMDITQMKILQEELETQKINQQRKITEATIMAQEKERTEIGRELHDNINQILTTTKLYIDMAIHEPEIHEQLLNKSLVHISSAIDEIRALSKSLVPPSLGDIGIREAIREMLGNLSINKDLKFDFKVNGLAQVTLEPAIKLMVFRIVQEQVNNIMRHSKATSAEIKLSVKRKMLNITISDNGIGFDTNKKSRGIGLNNIISRAELYNGTVDIISTPGNGCVLEVSIPVK